MKEPHAFLCGKQNVYQSAGKNACLTEWPCDKLVSCPQSNLWPSIAGIGSSTSVTLSTRFALADVIGVSVYFLLTKTTNQYSVLSILSVASNGMVDQCICWGGIFCFLTVASVVLICLRPMCIMCVILAIRKLFNYYFPASLPYF